jgi:glycosyltransferase involved in cell wall biosynthesis
MGVNTVCERFPILMVGNFLSASLGLHSICEDLAARLAADGWNVLTTSTRRTPAARMADMLSTVVRNRRHFEVAQVDVYSGPAFIWAEAVCWTLRRLGKPYVLTLHGGNLPKFAQRYPRRVGRLLASACEVTTPSNYLREQMQRHRSELRLLPNALDVGDYPFRLRSDPQPRLIWVRSFHAIYNPSLAPRAIGLLKEEFPEIQLVMLGPDKNDGSLAATRRAIDELDLSRNVTIAGAVPKADIPKWLSRSDVLMNTTNFDNTPVSVLEAMACGLCVVTTNVGGIPYLATDQQDALLVPPDDAEAMASALRRVLQPSSLAQHLSAGARATAERVDWSVILPQWNQVLANALNAKVR